LLRSTRILRSRLPISDPHYLPIDNPTPESISNTATLVSPSLDVPVDPVHKSKCREAHLGSIRGLEVVDIDKKIDTFRLVTAGPKGQTYEFRLKSNGALLILIEGEWYAVKD